MNIEQSRLDTFQSWPANAEVEPQRIAKAGFFYTGSGLEVECFSCGKRIAEWNYGDQVMARHRLLNSNCPFVIDPISSGNIPVVNRSPSLFSQISDPNSSNLSFSSLLNRDLSPNINSPNSRESFSDLNAEESLFQGSILSSTSILSVTSTVSNSVENSRLNDDISVYRSEAARLESFATWPKSHIVAPTLLAETGFFYLQDGDRVQCAFCLGKVHGWEWGDNPETEHRRHFPSCPSHNRSIEIRPSNDVPPPSSSTEILLGDVPTIADSQRETSVRHADERIIPSLNELGIHTHRGPINPKYSTIESRLRTFETWPNNIHQTPQQLAQAGFYYTGTNDQVRCFHCDGGLRQWDEHDDPWKEHARWFSTCTFVLLVKGEEFVQQANVEQPPFLSYNALQNGTNVPSETDHIEFRTYDVTEEELDRLMSTPEVRVALDVGFDQYKIKQVLRRKIEQSGTPFTCSDTLIEAVLDLSSDTNSIESPVEENASLPSEATREGSQVNPETSTSTSKPSQLIPLSSSKSLPSIAVCHVESSLQEFDQNAQSMPLLFHEKKGKKSLEVGKIPSSTLEEENRRLKEARLCKICMDEEVGVVFVPCGHLVTCVNCAANVQDCPMCRKPIKATVRTFLS